MFVASTTNDGAAKLRSSLCKTIEEENPINQIDDVKIANKLKDLSPASSADDSSLSNNSSSGTGAEDKHNNSLNNSLNSCEKTDDYDEFSGLFFQIDEHIYDEIVPLDHAKNRVSLDVKIDPRPAIKDPPKTEYSKVTLKIDEPIYDEPFVGNLTKIIPTNNAINTYDVPQSPAWVLGTSKYRRFGIVAPKIPKRSSSLMSITEDIENFHDALQPELCCHGRKNGCQLKHEKPEDISEDIFKENWMQKLDSLRKLETLLKDKEVALQSRERLLFKKEKELRILERLVKDKMRQVELYAKRFKQSLSADSIARNLESRSSDGSKERSKSDPSNVPTLRRNIRETASSSNTLRNQAKSRNSIITTDRASYKTANSRCKPKSRAKVRYDDLDSTLSAANGDESMIVTATKFDSEMFKKPIGFARSASERRPRIEQKIAAARLASLIETNEIPRWNLNIQNGTLQKINFSKKIYQKMFQKMYFLVRKRSILEKKFIEYSNPTYDFSKFPSVINPLHHVDETLHATHTPGLRKINVCRHEHAAATRTSHDSPRPAGVIGRERADAVMTVDTAAGAQLASSSAEIEQASQPLAAAIAKQSGVSNIAESRAERTENGISAKARREAGKTISLCCTHRWSSRAAAAYTHGSSDLSERTGERASERERERKREVRVLLYVRASRRAAAAAAATAADNNVDDDDDQTRATLKTPSTRRSQGLSCIAISFFPRERCACQLAFKAGCTPTSRS
ncbi:unnamed protein product [Trichogramma brassicae]|uniref:Uncharacterized protein n=1 Tax=Trichogramma brassicae TaxID=86971 RepID=A0A6H5JBQ2_9HYME|nr:unnamed protein product [Trichogramma brassicae]